MEILIVVAIMTVVVKRGVEDVIHTVKGGTPPRYAAASARRKSGAAGRYWGQLWDDTWTDLLRKHADRRDRRLGASSPEPRPRGAATRFFAGLTQDGRRAMRRRWQDGWTRADEKRREKATRPRPGQVTVPGTVVPNAPSRPEDEDRPRPEPSVVPDEDDSPVPVPQDEPTDPTDPGQQDDEPSVPDNAPDSGPDNQTPSPLASTTTQEGTTTMTTTIPSADVTGFEPTLRWGETSAQGYRAMIGQVELCISKLTAAKVTDGALHADLASVMELTASAAAVMDSAMAKLAAHRIVAEAYHATPGAGEKEFMLNG